MSGYHAYVERRKDLDGNDSKIYMLESRDIKHSMKPKIEIVEGSLEFPGGYGPPPIRRQASPTKLRTTSLREIKFDPDTETFVPFFPSNSGSFRENYFFNMTFTGETIHDLSIDYSANCGAFYEGVKETILKKLDRVDDKEKELNDILEGGQGNPIINISSTVGNFRNVNSNGLYTLESLSDDEMIHLYSVITCSLDMNLDRVRLMRHEPALSQ